MEEMKNRSASTEGNENEGFSFPCGSSETISKMMGMFMKSEKGGFDCGEMMKKCCSDKKEPLDFCKMMKRMCGPSHEKRVQE